MLTNLPILSIITYVPLVGALDEWHQLYVPGRNSSVFDWMIDAAGAVVAVFVYRRLASRRKQP